MRNPKHLFVALVLLLHLPFYSCGQEKAEPVAGAIRLFETLVHRDSVTVTIDTDWGRIIRKKMEEEYQRAHVIICAGADTLVDLDAQVASRGAVRKQVCFNPPLKLKFGKSDLRNLGFDGHHVLKLVMQCTMGGGGESLAEKEMAAYGLYRILTPQSFRIRPIRLIILNKGKNRENNIFDGFIIEPEKELADRMQGQIPKRETCSVLMVERPQFNRMAVFQYMIGNTDWAVANLHNLKVLKVPEYHKLIPVPYDFDYAGMVDAHYAVPTESLDIKSVRERRYLGFSCSEEDADKLAAEFLAKKQEFLAFCNAFPWAEDRTRRSVVKYLDDFFEELENPRQFRYVFGNGINHK